MIPDARVMGNKEKQYRECDECGQPIESGNPSARLCKRCAAKYQNKRIRDGSRYRSKDQKKKNRKKSKEEDFYEEEFDY